MFQSRMKKIKSRRKHFRQMLFDAFDERKKLIESMGLQKREEEVLRRKLQKLVALDNEPVEKAPNLVDLFFWVYLIFQVITCVIYWVACDYSDDTNSPPNMGYTHRSANWYTIWVHVAMLVLAGFSFFYTFMRKYAYSAISHTFLITVLAAQWTILHLIFWQNVDDGGDWARGDLTILSLIDGYYGATACLITFGFLLGKASPLQLVFLTLFEVGFYALNRFVVLMVLDAVDIGGAQTVHLFGTLFGLGVVGVQTLIGQLLQEDKERLKEFEKDKQSSYVSNIFTLLGTLIMFVMWPGWNAAYAPNGSQYRVVVNTFLAITSSCIMAFLTSRTIRAGKFLMFDIQRATLAGGIAIGSATPVVVSPGGAMVIGLVAGIVSVLGYAYVNPAIGYFKIHDHAGVLSLHGLSGLLAGVAGIISTAIACQNDYVFGQPVEELFLRGGSQAGYQVLCLIISIGIGLGGGIATGVVLFFLDMLAQYVPQVAEPEKMLYSDQRHFHVPADFERTIVPSKAPAPKADV